MVEKIESNIYINKYININIYICFLRGQKKE